MKALPAIAMGLVIVVLDVYADRLDLIPDVLGWGLVIYGVLRLRGRVPAGALLGTALVAGVISGALFDKEVVDSLEPSTGWLLSLPHVAFDILLAGALAGALDPTRPDLASRYRALRWVFVVVAVGPVLLFGGELEAVLVPLAVLTVASYVYFIYLLIRSSEPFESTVPSTP